MDTLAQARGEPDAIDIDASDALEPVRDVALFMIDRQGRVASWNEGVRGILGWEREDWVGQPVQVAFTPDDVQRGVPQAELGRAAATGSSDDTRWMLRKDGTRFFAHGALSRLRDSKGHTVGYLKAVRDATAQHETDGERSRAHRIHEELQALSDVQAGALTAVIDAVSDGVVISDRQGVQRCNASALALLGVGVLRELQVGADRWVKRFALRRDRHGAPMAAADAPMQVALTGRCDVQDLWATQASSGLDVALHCVGLPIITNGRVEGSVAIFSDLKERLQLRQKHDDLNRAQDVLQERDAELRALVDGVQGYAIYTLDTAGRVSSWHPGAQVMMGYSATEAVGTDFAGLFTEQDRAAGRPAIELAQAVRLGEFKGVGQRLRKDGSRFDAAVVLTALRGSNGEELGFLKLTQDISSQLGHQREREEMLAAALAARTEAARASQAKSDFLATISHELRTPLSAMLGWAHVLQRGEVDAGTLQQGLAAIARNARLQGQLIEDLLDMGRIEAGQLRLDLQRTDLCSAVAAAIDSARPAATLKGVDLRSISSPCSSCVLGDAARLQQVVANLLNNAIKFTPQGGQVSVSLTQAPGQLQLAVTDTGQGFEPEFLAGLFHRFQQQDGSSTRRHGGLGLGLAIVRHLVELHGGTVQAASPGSAQGATFTVQLPLLDSADMAPLAAASDAIGDTIGNAVGNAVGDAVANAAGNIAKRQADAAVIPRLDGLRVLLVDDEADMRAITGQLLQDAGAELCLAASAGEGWAALRSFAADVVVSDIGMPGVDGYEFVRQLRTRPATQGGQTPALAYTAYTRPEDRDRALAAGFQQHLGKPATPPLLLQALARLARPRDRGPGLPPQRIVGTTLPASPLAAMRAG